MSETPRLVQVKNISFKSGKVSILENITFNIKYGSFVAVIGPNGAGKSTLIKIMLGLLKQTEGEVLYEGLTPEFVNRNRHLLGYVPQNFSLDRTLPITLDEFFRFTCKIKKDAEFDATLKMLNLFHLKNNMMGNLSGGEIQRALIAYNLIHNHEIIFLDEPTSAIDIEGETLIYSLLKDINERLGKTVIIISHDIDTVLKNVDTVICLNKTLHCIGCPHEIVSGGLINELFESKRGFYKHGSCNHDHK